jgi:fido (protein-threonine AMPylation protein)
VIEPEDLIFPDTAAHSFKFAIPEPGALSHAAMDSIASKLTGLESTPVIGAFDARHLQEIHARIFEDALPRAGKLRKPRPSSLASSLDSLFDKLTRENRLKGLELNEWSKRATEYLHGIERINPFDEGSDIASIELFRELATESGLTVRWSQTLTGPSIDELQVQLQALQSNNLRRVLILAVDPDLPNRKSLPNRDRNNSLDLIPFL